MIRITTTNELTDEKNEVYTSLNPIGMVRQDWVYLFRSVLTGAGWSGEQADEIVPDDGCQECACQCTKKEAPAWAFDMIDQFSEIINFHVQDRDKWAKAVDMIETLRELLGVEG